MKKIIPIMLLLGAISFLSAQTIGADKYAAFTVPSDNTTDTLSAYFKDLGIRKINVADADGDGDKEILAVDYSNGGRVHVLEVVSDSLLEIIWSSPVATSKSASTPRSVAVGDCDGDGNLEIIFGQNNFANVDGSFGRIVFYEWNGTDWGTEKAFDITPSKFATAVGGSDENRKSLRFKTEHLTVFDLDGDGRSEIIAGGGSVTGVQDVIIMGVTFTFPGFAGISIEGGKPGTQTNGADWVVGGSLMSSVPADIDGDGKLEIINHTYSKFGFWSIDVDGKNTYTYPEATDNADAKAKGAYHEYAELDAVSYPGAMPIDVNGDGRDEIVGTMYVSGANNGDIGLLAFSENDNDVYIWDEASQTENFSVIAPDERIAAVSGKSSVFLWPVVGGDLNKNGIDEIYTGGGRGFDVVAITYKGAGSLLDSNSYDITIVDDGEGGEVFGTIEIYNGRVGLQVDTTVIGDSLALDTTNVTFEAGIIDTIPDSKTRPFTASLFADNVDLDGDGNLEIVVAGQGIFDSTKIKIYDRVWNDSTDFLLGGRWDLNNELSYNIFNSKRQTIRVLEYNGGTVGFKAIDYGIITPDDYKLEQNFPNPFNPTTTINFTLPLDKDISLKVYDMLGKEVKSLLIGKSYKKGNHKVIWDGTNNFGSKVASGNYVAKLEFGSFAKSIKMTLLK